MTGNREQSNHGMWVGLGIGVVIAWTAWAEWFSLTDGFPKAYEALRSPNFYPLPWRNTWWGQSVIIALLVLFALSCAVAGTLIGQRAARPRTTQPDWWILYVIVVGGFGYWFWLWLLG
jgi:hypothetical protein